VMHEPDLTETKAGRTTPATSMNSAREQKCNTSSRLLRYRTERLGTQEEPQLSSGRRGHKDKLTENQSHPRKPTRRGDDLDGETKTNYVRSSSNQGGLRLSNRIFVLHGWPLFVRSVT